MQKDIDGTQFMTCCLFKGFNSNVNEIYSMLWNFGGINSRKGSYWDHIDHGFLLIRGYY